MKQDEGAKDEIKQDENKHDESYDKIKQDEKSDERSDKNKIDEKIDEHESDEDKNKSKFLSVLSLHKMDNKLISSNTLLNVVKTDEKLKAFVEKLSKKKNIFDEIAKKNKKKKIEDPKEADMAERIWKKRPPNKSIKEKDTITCKTSQIK